MQDPLLKIIEWAKREEAIKAVILLGSRAEKRPIDELSDYDLALFCDTFAPFVESDAWIHSLGDVWVCFPTHLTIEDKSFPTRLVIFEQGLKVDFALYTLDMITKLKEYPLGYQVLVDKENLTAHLPKPTYEGFKTPKPTVDEFLHLIEEFWFEVYHVAKYLKRDDLWSVKSRTSDIHNHLLLKMIRWHESAKHDWNYSTHSLGKRMQSWVSTDTWNALQGIFAHFDGEDGWKSLENLIALFRTLATETARSLGSAYPHELDKNMTTFIHKLHQESGI